MATVLCIGRNESCCRISEAGKAVTADWVELWPLCQKSYHGYTGCFSLLAEGDIFNCMNLIRNCGNQIFGLLMEVVLTFWNIFWRRQFMKRLIKTKVLSVPVAETTLISEWKGTGIPSFDFIIYLNVRSLNIKFWKRCYWRLNVVEIW